MNIAIIAHDQKKELLVQIKLKLLMPKSQRQMS
jgi:methylglyoxal synthase